MHIHGIVPSCAYQPYCTAASKVETAAVIMCTVVCTRYLLYPSAKEPAQRVDAPQLLDNPLAARSDRAGEIALLARVQRKKLLDEVPVHDLKKNMAQPPHRIFPSSSRVFRGGAILERVQATCVRQRVCHHLLQREQTLQLSNNTERGGKRCE